MQDFPVIDGKLDDRCEYGRRVEWIERELDLVKQKDSGAVPDLEYVRTLRAKCQIDREYFTEDQVGRPVGWNRCLDPDGSIEFRSQAHDTIRRVGGALFTLEENLKSLDTYHEETSSKKDEATIIEGIRAAFSFFKDYIENEERALFGAVLNRAIGPPHADVAFRVTSDCK